MSGLTFDEFLATHRRQIEEIYQSSGGVRWSVAMEDFAQAAWKGVASAAWSDHGEIPRLLASLRAQDLALALGCSRGDDRAWDTFCSDYRGPLYDAARSVTHEESSARELADSLLAELFGLDASKPCRNSRFTYYHGRSSLKTWLRAVLYQKYVDEYRRQAHTPELVEDAAELASLGSSVSEEDDRRYAGCLGEAVETALGDLAPEERLLLGLYYVQELTLKQIGRLSGGHEATISRRLEALRRKLRKRIEKYLRSVAKLSALEIDRCLDFASRGALLDLERLLRPK